eukprot:EC812327.1.p2 GENE.EC812327.1~~EC812327.1.p2  ORF type:complete len:58 (-),score=5.18 EC812327.1:49-222(-)
MTFCGGFSQSICRVLCRASSFLGTFTSSLSPPFVHVFMCVSFLFFSFFPFPFSLPTL